jgi:hypothetical protein
MGPAVEDDWEYMEAPSSDNDWVYEPVKSAPPVSDEQQHLPIIGSYKRVAELGARGVVKGLTGLADLAYMAVTLPSMASHPVETKFANRLSSVVDPVLDRAITPPDSTIGKVFEAGVAGATMGPQAIVPSFVSGAASEVAKHANAPWWVQTGVGILAGWGTQAGISARKAIPGGEKDIDLLLRNREASGRVTDDLVQRQVSNEYKAAMEPFKEPFRRLKATTFKRPVVEEMLDIPASRPTEYINGRPISGNFALKSMLEDVDNAAHIKGDRYLRAQAKDLMANEPRTVGDVMARLERLGDAVGKTRKAGDFSRSRVLLQMKTALQADLDTMVASTGANDLRKAYGVAVKSPYGKLQGTMSKTDDASQFWRQFERMTPEAKQRLNAAISPTTRQTIQQRIVRVIKDQEETFTGGQAGSGARAWRGMNARGMGVFFEPDTWKGVGKIASANAAVRNPVVRATAEAVTSTMGAMLGSGAGPVGTALGTAAGYGSAKLMEQLLTSVKGRTALAVIGRMPERIKADDWSRINAALATIAAETATDALPATRQEEP